MIRTMRERFLKSMGLKFVAALTIVISVLMVLGTLFVTQMLLDLQYRTLKVRGHELGLFLGKAVSDPLLFKNIPVIDSLVSEAVKTKDMFYMYIVDGSGSIMSSVYGSFNSNNAEVQAFLAKEKSDNVDTVVSQARKRHDILEVSAEITAGSTKLGTVRMGFTKAGIKKDTWTIAWLLLGTSVGIVVVLAAIVYGMARKMIVTPTAETVAVASGVAAGDLTQSIRIRSNDELGMLGRGLNEMIAGLKNMIVRVQEAAISLGSVAHQVKEISTKIASGGRDQSEAVEEAASSVNEMHFTLKEIAGNVDDLHKNSEHTSSSVLEMAASIDEVAKTMTDLSGSIEDTSTAITEMSAAIKQIAENIDTLSSAAEETAATASEISASVREVESNAKQSASLAEAVATDAQQLGMRSIEKTIVAMGKIEGAARHTADVVGRLRERSENIGSILTVIEDITDQTGLLALNAAILAAQAGEHGKGFAVVAAEIRELANRTAASTQEIGKLISSVQEESRGATEAMVGGVALIEEGVKLSKDAGEALKKILERAGQSRDMSKSISKAAAEQAHGVKQVSEAVDKINEMTHQIARATQEQKSGSEQIMRSSEKMREITRFIKSASTEQAKGSRDITAAVENISIKIGMVNQAAGEVRAGSDLIVKAIERIKTAARENTNLSVGLNNAVDVMSGQSDTLKQSVEKFKTQ